MLRQHGVMLQIAKAAGKRHMLGWRDVLIAKDKYLVCHQRLTQLLRLRVAQGLAQINAGNLHANGGGDSLELNTRLAGNIHTGLCMADAVFAIDHDVSPKRCKLACGLQAYEAI